MSPEVAIEADLSPDISKLAIEDDTPVDNLISEKQQRLLTEPLYSNASALGGRTFLLAANVGVFYAVRQPPLVPVVFLSLDVEVPQDGCEKKNRTLILFGNLASYPMWSLKLSLTKKVISWAVS